MHIKNILSNFWDNTLNSLCEIGPLIINLNIAIFEVEIWLIASV